MNSEVEKRLEKLIPLVEYLVENNKGLYVNLGDETIKIINKK